MKKILLFVLSLWSIGLQAQNTEADNKTLIDFIRNSGLTPARVANALDAINYSKVSIVGIYTASGTNTYAVTAGTGITNNDANKQLIIKFTNANTSSTVTLNVNGIGALPLKTNLNADPDVGGIPAGSIYLIGSTGTTWRMIGPTNAGGIPVPNWGDIPKENLDDQTDLYDTLNTKARKVYKIKPIASNYTAALGDHDNKLIIVNGGADFKIPKDADVDFPLGATLLAVDTLGTATFSADPAVTIDSTDQSQISVKVAANKWVSFKSNSGSSSGAYWPLAGSATQTGEVTIDGGGNSFIWYTGSGAFSAAETHEAGQINLTSHQSGGTSSDGQLILQSTSAILSSYNSTTDNIATFQATPTVASIKTGAAPGTDRYTIDADGNHTSSGEGHAFTGVELTSVMTLGGNTASLEMYPGIGNFLKTLTTTAGDDYSSLIGNYSNLFRADVSNTTDDSNWEMLMQPSSSPATGSFRIGTGPTGSITTKFEITYGGGLLINNTTGTSGQVLTSGGSGNPTTWTTPYLTGSATLNFDLTSVNYEDLTVTCTGAAAGDVVSIGVPNGAVVADVTYFGWVSATNTVSIRASRVGGGGAANPASGTFKVKVTP